MDSEAVSDLYDELPEEDVAPHGRCKRCGHPLGEDEWIEYDNVCEVCYIPNWD